MKEFKKEVCLEPSTSTHTLRANKVLTDNIDGDIGGMKLTIHGQGIVVHGHHGPIATESQHIIKINQKEVNPITKKLEDAID